MTSWTKNKQTGQWDVIGLESEVKQGQNVTVKNSKGEIKIVSVEKISKPFLANYGQNSGKRCVIAAIGADKRRATCNVGGRRYRRESGYCYYPCPVTRKVCSPENGPCHDCE